MIKDNPFLGVGIGNWKINLPKYGLDNTHAENGSLGFIRPHNDFLWVFAETGIIGFLLFSSIFSLCIYMCIKLLFKDININDKVLIIAILFGICGYIIISLFDFPKERIEHLIYLVLLISIISSIYFKYFQLHKRGLFFKKNIFLIILILISVILFINYSRFIGEIHFVKAFKAKQQGNFEKVVSEIEKSQSFFYTLDPTSTPLLWHRGVANYSMGKIDEAFVDFKESYKYNPYEINVLNNLGTCYELKGKSDSAIIFLKKSLEISGNFEESLLNLCAVYYNIGEYDKAYNLIKSYRKTERSEKYNKFFLEILKKIKNKE
jgi:tetratricopeptide (TPR) repeat protein